jgi:hypothetical protein
MENIFSVGGSATTKRLFAAKGTVYSLCFKTSLSTMSYMFLFTLYTGGHKYMLNTGKVYFNFVLFVPKISVEISYVITQSAKDTLYIS